MTRTNWTVAASLVLAACQQGATGQEDRSVATNVAADGGNQCKPPTLSLADGSQLQSKLLEETNASFGAAYESACRKGVMNHRTLIDPKAADQGKLFLINAPEANVASIYRSEVDGNRMVLEYPFLTTDGKTHVPTAGELEEAIYCAAVGATPQEQESTGRCLVD